MTLCYLTVSEPVYKRPRQVKALFPTGTVREFQLLFNILTACLLTYEPLVSDLTTRCVNPEPTRRDIYPIRLEVFDVPNVTRPQEIRRAEGV